MNKKLRIPVLDTSEIFTVQFLWLTKIRSRESFLMILQFINVGTDHVMTDFRKLLHCLSPTGLSFFYRFVTSHLLIREQIRIYTHTSCQFQKFMRKWDFTEPYTDATLKIFRRVLDETNHTCKRVVEENTVEFGSIPFLAQQRRQFHRFAREARTALAELYLGPPALLIFY